MIRRCPECIEELDLFQRSDAVYCGQRCRDKAYRRRRGYLAEAKALKLNVAMPLKLIPEERRWDVIRMLRAGQMSESELAAWLVDAP